MALALPSDGSSVCRFRRSKRERLVTLAGLEACKEQRGQSSSLGGCQGKVQKGFLSPQMAAVSSRSFFSFPVSISFHHTVFSILSSSVKSSHGKQENKGLAT